MMKPNKGGVTTKDFGAAFSNNKDKSTVKGANPYKGSPAPSSRKSK